MRLFFSLILHLIPLCWHIASVLSAQSNSIVQQTAYNEQRGCIKSCLWGSPPNGDLSVQLGCSSPWVNECYCRADAPPRASKILSACISTACTDVVSPTIDVSSAISVYNGYCAKAMSFPATNAAEPTVPGGGSVTTVISVATVTAASGSQSSSKCNYLVYGAFVVLVRLIGC
ncbi:uncharacterized protein BDR25DRAFT_266686 [Lindgomyces ingoldianus]|uniref:Uncharacterized protein n=1 Tax=Lindgomyces ingoldianus TaxID=673940 RepID=A0ACB6QNG3_9PLEO|nr:uncharacterized protein BDR25DRAFT_266686 [Lindgomyces ingoldianus]KAF2467691.1 hypothetical protein BDR25DRAFT_266686 [Lindgomyces ingoldianus]